MERYLITQTLLSSWAYVFNCRDECAEDAMADFLRTLNREKTEATEAMLDGIAFENEVYSPHSPFCFFHLAVSSLFSPSCR